MIYTCPPQDPALVLELGSPARKMDGEAKYVEYTVSV
jgi:hypothetical protein